MVPKSKEDASFSNIGWLVCGIASLFYFYEFAQITVLNSLSDQIIRRYSINATQLSNLSAIYFYINVILLLPAGIILDTCSARKSILFAMGCSILGTIVFATSTSLSIAQIGRALSGVGGAFCFASCIKLIINWIPSNKIDFAVSGLVTIGFLGGITAQIPFVLLNKNTGWDTSLASLIFLGCAFWLLILITVKDKANTNTERPPLSNLLKLLKTSANNRQTWFCGCYITLMNLPIIILATLWNNMYLQKANELNIIDASLVSSLLIVGIAIGSPISALISEKTCSRKKIMITGSVLSFCTLYLIINGHDHLLYIAIMFFSLGLFSSTQCLGYPAILENNSREASAVTSSIASTMVLGGGALLKVLFGFLLDYSWSGKVENSIRVYSKSNFETGLSLLLLCFAISTVLAFLIKDASREKERTL